MTHRKGLGYFAGKCYGVIGAGKKNIPQRWVPQNPKSVGTHATTVLGGGIRS